MLIEDQRLIVSTVFSVIDTTLIAAGCWYVLGDLRSLGSKSGDQNAHNICR